MIPRLRRVSSLRVGTNDTHQGNLIHGRGGVGAVGRIEIYTRLGPGVISSWKRTLRLGAITIKTIETSAFGMLILSMRRKVVQFL